MIITLAHQKGGVGKSTLATNLAATLGADILDLDLQRSCQLWNRSRKAAGLPELTCHTPNTAAEAKSIIANYKGSNGLLVVDCGGFDSETNRVALALSNIILTPVSPSQIELYGLQNFMKILKEASQQLGREIVTNVVINNADSRSKAAIEEVQAFIQSANYLELMETVIHWRSDFKKAYAFGQSVLELNGKGKAAAEITALAAEIKSTF
jgi:chromosome partitioning protein